MGRFDTAIVIPAFNECKTIVAVIAMLRKYGDVIIVDDGSSDSTGQIAQETSATVLFHKSNLGYEVALSTGIEYAINKDYLYVITTDADGELKSIGIEQIKEKLKQNNLIVVGNRDTKNRLIESFFGKLCFFTFGISDPLCGMKGYSTKFLKKYGFFDKNRMIGTEMLALALRDDITIQEVPIDVKKRSGDSRFGGAFSSFLKITRVVFLFFRISLQKRV